MLINLIGLCLLSGRILQAIGVSSDPEPMRLRVIGMALTLSAFLIGTMPISG
jgi:uncharacterized membrane protein YecN with MAPEG domain